jgi:hypothetical protein
MKIFLSWSGEKSRIVASALSQWLPSLVPTTKPWMSEQIRAGDRWESELVKELKNTDCGVLCLTAENLQSPWLNFEAGALSKAVDKSRVIPYPESELDPGRTLPGRDH